MGGNLSPLYIYEVLKSIKEGMVQWRTTINM